MNRIQSLFDRQHEKIRSVYFCAGAPRTGLTAETIRTLQAHGIHLIEIGIPFSDPLADGPTIQAAATTALRNGTTLHSIFDELADIRHDVHVPLILMGYLNPILQFGFENFCRACQQCGIDGVIIPDLPFDEYEADYKDTARRYGLSVIFLVTPETSEERIRRIDDQSDSFIYAVSSAAVTGTQHDFDLQKQAYFERLKNMRLRNPFLIGFGISNRATREAAERHAAGTIVGSKFVSLLDECQEPETAVVRLLEALDN